MMIIIYGLRLPRKGVPVIAAYAPDQPPASFLRNGDRIQLNRIME
jgi:hypothetical protein